MRRLAFVFPVFALHIVPEWAYPLLGLSTVTMCGSGWDPLALSSPWQTIAPTLEDLNRVCIFSLWNHRYPAPCLGEMIFFFCLRTIKVTILTNQLRPWLTHFIEPQFLHPKWGVWKFKSRVISDFNILYFFQCIKRCFNPVMVLPILFCLKSAFSTFQTSCLPVKCQIFQLTAN